MRSLRFGSSVILGMLVFASTSARAGVIEPVSVAADTPDSTSLVDRFIRMLDEHGKETGAVGASRASTVGPKTPACCLPPHEAPRKFAAEAAPSACTDRPPALSAEWIGASQWMIGISVSGGEVYYNSIGRHFIGFVESNLTNSQYVPVEIRFDPETTSVCQVFRFDQSMAAAGVGTFPGSAWDLSVPGTPRRLNICFAEWNDGAGPVPPPNFYWDPDTTKNSPRFGKFEFAFVMLSSYDGTGATYAGTNLSTQDQDVLYCWYPRLNPGHTMFESLPASIRIGLYRDYITDVFPLPDERQITLYWTYCGLGTQVGFRIFRDAVSPATTPVAFVGPFESSFLDTGLTNETTYYYRIHAIGANDSLLGYSSQYSGKPVQIKQDMTLAGRCIGWGGEYGGIWGYTDSITRKEYALVCNRSYSTVEVVDLDQTVPIEGSSAGFVTPLYGGGSDTKEVKVYRHYVFALSEYGPINVYDMSTIGSGFAPYVGSVTAEGDGCHDLLVDGHYLYVVGNHGRGGLEIFDIVNPAAAVKVGEYQPYYYHDVTIRKDTLYCYAIYGQGIDILNVANKAAPQLIGHFNYPGSGAHNGELSRDGRTLFVGDEIGSGNWTRIFDVSNPAAVTKIGDIIVDPASVVHNCYRRGDLLYLAHYGRGVRIWNIANPAAPFEVGFYDTQPTTDDGYGAWTAYPLFPSGRIIASDMGRGLFVLTYDPGAGPLCACDCHGDPECDSVEDVLDVVAQVGVAFRSATPAPDPNIDCPKLPVDVNCDGVVDVLDIVRGVNVVFRGANPATEYCDPCL